MVLRPKGTSHNKKTWTSPVNSRLMLQHGLNSCELFFVVFCLQAFSKIVQSKRVPGETPGWRCCDDDFTELRDIHRHIAQNHSDAVDSAARIILENGDTDAR